MRNKRLIYFVFIVLSLWQNHSALAQNQSSLEKRALQAFEQLNYASALVDYRQLLAKDQQNPQFNYYYGVCVYQVESHYDAAKYFDVALGLKQIPDPLLYYYRAKIYQEQYFFEQAISAYEAYQRLSLNSKTPIDVQIQINECRRALAEITAFIRLPLLSVAPIRSPQFYKAFNFSPEDYTFYEAPEVHSKNNAKQRHVPVYAYKRGMKYRIISSYGPKGTQLDLYLQKKDANNNWGTAALVGGQINDPLANEVFGFYDASSQTLYFSSTSKSIGGYDLYKASFDLSTNTASQVEKMPYPYSSPTDDFFYVCDALQNQAYFATARQGIVGQYEIYTLQLDAPVRPNFIFAGNFSNELQPLSKAISLQFTDLLTNEVYGPFVSDATGAYAVALPLKGDFLLEIQVDGASKAYQTRFSIPQLKPQTALQQQVLYFNDELGKEQWQVRNQLIELDPATQIAGLSKLQFNVAKGSLLQAKSSTITDVQPLQTTLAATWGFAAQDTATFIAQMTDTLLAAEVSLENQVRLMELLRQDFEQQLNVREQLLAKLSQFIDAPNSPAERSDLLEELAAVEQALAFNQRWIQINQAANIPDLALLDTLRAMNERHQALLLTGDSLALLAGWTQRREVLQQYLQIAAFDGSSALEAAQLDDQLRLQKIIKEENLVKEQQQQLVQQIKKLQTDLALQSKKEQAQTQQTITSLQRDLSQVEVLAKQLVQARQSQAEKAQVYDQAQRKEAFLKAAENQSLPQVNLQSSYDELLAQYAQQEDLSQNLKSQLNTSSTTNPNSTSTNPNNASTNQDLTNTQRTTTSQPDPISSENGNVSPLNPTSSENGNVSPTNPNNASTNQDLTNTQRTTTSQPDSISTENGNVSPTNPNSPENGNLESSQEIVNPEIVNSNLTSPENGNLGSNQESGNPEIVNSNISSPENGNLGSNQESGNPEIVNSNLTTTNPISSENGNLSSTNPNSPENGNVGSNQESGNPEIVNSNLTTTNPISSENGTVGSNQESGNPEIVNLNLTSPENGNLSSTNPNSPENGNLGSNQESGNPEIVNSNLSTTNPNSSENGNVSSTNPISSENRNLGSNQESGNPEIVNSNLTSPENGNLGANDNQKIIEQKILRFEEQILAISALDSDQLPSILPKTERLGLSNKELDQLELDLTLPSSAGFSSQTNATTPLSSEVEIQGYVNYVAQRTAFEQTKNQLQQNQLAIRSLEEAYTPAAQEQLLQLLEAQEVLLTQLKTQKQTLIQVKDQALFETLLLENFRPQVTTTATATTATTSSILGAPSAVAFQIQERSNTTTPLPVGLPCPEGLVFRVQVGAFRKPVPAERFREFTQVDGQVLANGLTVYMAGYFSTSAEALLQQKLIRSLGYPDAFVVAYQNCSRLSLAQGRSLENSPFAAPGEGLYYTVQVGVYNRPLTNEAQLGLPELIEAKTAKGQFRYASGKFANLQDAKKRQQLAVNKGIKDAFIVAYYQGKRIDLAQAKLLAQSGIAFEQNFEQNKVQPLSLALQNQLLALQIPQPQPLIVPDPVCRFEIKCTDCQAELSRYNRVGVFIFDPEKEIIVSALQKTSEWDVVQLMYLKEMRKKTPVMKGETQTIQLAPNGLEGALIDWLLRQQNGYELDKDQEGELQLRYILPTSN